MSGFTARAGKRFLLALAWAVLLPPAQAAQAPELLPGGVSLGMSLAAVQGAVPDAAAVRHPVRMAGGLVGRLSGPPVVLAQTAFAPTYFFANGVLTRVEYLAQGPAAASAFDAVAGWCERQWGPALRSDNPEGSYATWSREDAGIYLQETGQPGPQLRLVVRLRAPRDASEL